MATALGSRAAVSLEGGASDALLPPRQDCRISNSSAVGVRLFNCTNVIIPKLLDMQSIALRESITWANSIPGFIGDSPDVAVSLGSVSVGSAAAAGGGVASRLEPDSPLEALASGCRAGVSGKADGAGVSSPLVPGWALMLPNCGSGTPPQAARIRDTKIKIDNTNL